MGDLIQAFGDGFTGMLEPMATGIKTGFTHLIYQDPAAESRVLSDLAQVGMLIGGAACAIGLIFGMFRMVRNLL